MAEKEKSIIQKGASNIPAEIPDKSDYLAALAGLNEFRAAAGGDIDGLERLDASDIKMPKMKIVQFTSKEFADGKAQPGQFYNSVTERAYDSLPCILLALGKRNTMWNQPFKRGELPLCYSADGKRGLTVSGEERHCAKCPYQDWNKAQERGEKKPPCNMSYVWLGAVGMEDDKSLFRFITSGKSVSPTKNFLNEIAINMLPPYVYNVLLTTKKEQNDQGIFYVLEYKIVGAATKDQAKEREALKAGAWELFNRAVAQDAITGEGEAEEVTGDKAEGVF